jgi:chemotaxis protein MotA
MDIATVFGLVTGIGLILWAIMSKTSIMTFVDYGSVAIVMGGSVAATLIAFPLKNVLGLSKVLMKTVFTKAQSQTKLIADLVTYAEVARRDGILALENVVADIKDPFIVSGIQMAVDGTDPAMVEQMLQSEMEALAQRHADGKALFDSVGRYAPAFGMIGTLVGLVIMLQNMDDPSAIGPGMAVALLTTMYGAIVANLVALPLADKLGLRSQEEMFLKEIIIKGIIAIQQGDNPRIVEQKLKTFLPPSQRTFEIGGEAA